MTKRSRMTTLGPLGKSGFHHGGGGGGSPYLALPWLYDVGTDLSPALNVGDEVTDVDPNWTRLAGQGGAKKSDNTDGKAGTNANVTGGIIFDANAYAESACYPVLLFPKPTDPNITVLRMASCLCTSYDSESGQTYPYDVTPAQAAEGATSLNRPTYYRRTVQNPNSFYFNLVFGGEAAHASAVGISPSTNVSGREWVWTMFEFNFSTGAIWFGAKRPGAGLSYTGTSGVGAHPSFSLSCVAFRSWTGPVGRMAKFWIGTGDDDWPV